MIVWKIAKLLKEDDFKLTTKTPFFNYYILITVGLSVPNLQIKTNCLGLKIFGKQIVAVFNT